MHQRNKVGGILDRRFGENDPTMTPEEKAAERFARESQRKLRKESMFNLEEEEEEIVLTHKGQSLDLDGAMDRDDFQDDLEEEDISGDETPRKRKRAIAEDGGMEVYEENSDEEQPERKKSKHEVMKEVIAKSKFYKHQRQMAKEDDEDMREELDKELPNLFSMLRGVPPPPKQELTKEDSESMNPERVALLNGASKPDANKEYDQRLKQLTFDKRSQPTDRTKTEEEKAEEEAQRLKELEEERLRRMRGEEMSDDEDEAGDDDASDDESIPDDAKAFGLQHAPSQTTTRPDLGVEDEDDFIIDDDLVETRSDVSLEFDKSDEEEDESSAEESDDDDDDDEDLLNGLALPTEERNNLVAASEAKETNGELQFTYPCPEDHQSFLKIIKGVPLRELPTVIQRIRALYHPRLHKDNKAKLGRFASILVEHAAYMVNQSEHPPFAIVENVLRHIHSLAKSHPENVSMAFRTHLRNITTQRPLDLLPGDLVILTGIATIFPTSDHFHAIATPAHLCLARYLGQGSVNSLANFAIGAYAASLCLQYQSVSKRFMPESINYILNAICNLCPEEMKKTPGFFPSRKPQEPLRLAPSSKLVTYRKLRFWDIIETGDCKSQQTREKEQLKVSLIATFVDLLDSASDIWSDNSAFLEIFEPGQHVLQHVSESSSKNKLPTPLQDKIQACLDKLGRHLSQARLARRPLLLHNHRPLAIKSSIPKFEENFNPDKHYDPNRERAELNKLKAEYKRERKGAMRELRKDANFIAREKLREKRERDAEYEKKYKRLIAEIQNQEGREANAYEKEKRARQGKR
ncbi:hypothetical protein MAP00_003216 [Monascus purpureus]|nr:hypothetical protein MAP00_003216 [Monascus purpureus]